ncbi:mechanosensitive ion channel family protein [Nonlabens xiamenensis]|uniref:mechanosensitive ion channel family protein n=1 Tax=Nonlabens xiamenensis TaxID=2341043 RepID=UPI000F6080A3|nr:mechanosensitive ion channel family protein [Nonlabens xiamenensis]
MIKFQQTQEVANSAQKTSENSAEIKDSGALIWEQLTSWYNSFIKHLPNIGIAIVVLIVAYFVSKYVDKGVRRLMGNKAQSSVKRLAGKFVAILVVLGGIFIAMSVLQLNDAVQGIIAGAGISGLVIGLALQGSLSNIISGIVLSFRKEVKVGDWIETTDFAGEVTEIQLDKFIIKQADNNLVVIPNKTIMDNPMKNWSLTPRMRVVLECGVGYESDLDAVKELAINTIKEKFPPKNNEEIEFFYTEFGGSSINFMLRFWIDAKKAKQKHQALSESVIAIKKAFDGAGVNIPFPIRTLEFNNKLSLEKVAQEESRTASDN